jgi:hypothetical protein
MDSFESLIKTLLERDGFWVRSCFKVNLTKADKRAIRRPSCPRWEIDVLAYNASRNELRLVECKSFLDSPGVRFSGLTGNERVNRYKLFTDARLRRVVINRLVRQLVEAGSCRPRPGVVLCLAAGKIRGEGDRRKLRQLFKTRNWLLWDDEWICSALKDMSRSGYENDVASVVAKLLLRD